MALPAAVGAAEAVSRAAAALQSSADVSLAEDEAHLVELHAACAPLAAAPLLVRALVLLKAAEAAVRCVYRRPHTRLTAKARYVRNDTTKNGKRKRCRVRERRKERRERHISNGERNGETFEPVESVCAR